MAKRDFNKRYSERVKVEDKLEELPEMEELLEEVSTVRLRLRKDINLKITGPITGTQYVFIRAGAEVSVDSRDAELMIKRMGSNSCCSGSSGPTAYFEVVR